VPIVVPAPGLFSMITGCPRRGEQHPGGNHNAAAARIHS
jgi:hypothetical protein